MDSVLSCTESCEKMLQSGPRGTVKCLLTDCNKVYKAFVQLLYSMANFRVVHMTYKFILVQLSGVALWQSSEIYLWMVNQDEIWCDVNGYHSMPVLPPSLGTLLAIQDSVLCHNHLHPLVSNYLNPPSATATLENATLYQSRYWLRFQGLRWPRVTAQHRPIHFPIRNYKTYLDAGMRLPRISPRQCILSSGKNIAVFINLFHHPAETRHFTGRAAPS